MSGREVEVKYKLRCCYCGKSAKVGMVKAVKGCGTYVGWRHPSCTEPTNVLHWNQKVAEAQAFMVDLRAKQDTASV